MDKPERDIIEDINSYTIAHHGSFALDERIGTELIEIAKSIKHDPENYFTNNDLSTRLFDVLLYCESRLYSYPAEIGSLIEQHIALFGYDETVSFLENAIITMPEPSSFNAAKEVTESFLNTGIEGFVEDEDAELSEEISEFFTSVSSYVETLTGQPMPTPIGDATFKRLADNFTNIGRCLINTSKWLKFFNHTIHTKLAASNTPIKKKAVTKQKI